MLERSSDRRGGKERCLSLIADPSKGKNAVKVSLPALIALFLAATAASVAGVFAVFPGGLTFLSAGSDGLSVVLTVRNTTGVPRNSEPVTVGVPIARSAGVTSTDTLGLFDSSGRRVPAQFLVTSRWGGPPGDSRFPARWLLIDFEAGVEAGAEATYTLSDGGGGSPGTGLTVTRNDADFLEVSTGAARFTFSKRRFNVFDSVYVGDAQLVSPDGFTGIEAVDPGGRIFRSSAGGPDEVVLETDGPVRKTVRMRGGLAGPGGALLECVARVSLFAGSSDARVLLTLKNPRDPVESGGQPQFWDIGCPNSAAFEELDFILDCASGGALRLGGVDGADLESGGSLKVYQDSSGGSSWDRYKGRHPRPQSYVSFRGYRTYRDGSQVSAGDRPTPWLSVRGPEGGTAASLRDFWQNYPKALRAEGGRLEVSLFPTEYEGRYSFRPGEQKTHEVTFCFHGSGGESAAWLKAQAAQEPLLAAASPAYYMGTGALGPVTGITGHPEFDAYEELNTSTIRGSGANLFNVIEEAEFYSWQDYGEVPIDYENGGTGSFNHKYNFDLGMALQFMRTGDERWFRLADAAGRHVADLDLFHSEGVPAVWWDGGFFGHSYHDEDNNSNPNRNYGSPHPDLVFGAPGLYLRYYMTGDRVAYDAAQEISNNVKYRFDNSFGRGNGRGYAESPDYENGCLSARPFALGLWVLVEAYRATGDDGCLETADWLIRNSHEATDLFLTNPVPGDRRFTKLFMWDLLEFSLGKYLDLCSEIGRVDTSGARDQLLAMTRQEAYVMWKEDGRGNRGVPYAWMRDGTPWGWEDSEVAVNVSNWHLLTADVLTYGYIYGGDAELLERAREAFKTGSNPNIEYYEPAYTATKEATNSANFGLVYMHRKAAPASPSVETQPVTSVSQTTASCGGNVTSDGGAWVSERGVCWGMSSNPTTADAHTHDGTGTGPFSSSITGLSPGTLYHVRAYAKNSAGTSYGSDVSFTTQTTISLAEALDNSELTWTTGGGGFWFGQNLVSAVDSDSAQSPDLADGQSAYFETTAAGPCTVSFYWKTSSESGHDYLRFYIDGAEQAGAISGETSWLTASHSIAGGTHTLKWAFTKDGSGASGADCGWVDSVFKGTGAPVPAFVIPFGSLDNGNINIGNPGSIAAGVVLRVIDAAGSIRKTQNFSVPSKGVRRSWDLIGNIYDYGKPVSAEILSDRNLVADNIKWASPPYDTVSAGFTCSPVSLMAGTLFYFPFSSFGGWSNAYCVIVNTAASPANVTIDVFDSGGAMKKTSTFSVEPKSTVRSWDYVGSIQSWADPALLRVTSNRDIVVEAVRWEENKRGWGFSIFPSSRGGGTSFTIPFGSLDNGNINLANISGGPAGVTMRIRDAAGTSLAGQDFSIPARGVVRSWDLLGNLFGYGKPLTVEVTSGVPVVGDNIKWASPPYDTVGAGFTCGPAPLMKGKLFYYPFNSAGGTANAYCVISNTTSSASTVTIDVYDTNGTLKKTTSIAIAAKGVARSWDSVGSIQALADPALIRITSSQDVVVEAVRWEQNKRGWGFAILPMD